MNFICSTTQFSHFLIHLMILLYKKKSQYFKSHVNRTHICLLMSSFNQENLDGAICAIKLKRQNTSNMLIRLHGCVGKSAGADPEIFFRVGPTLTTLFFVLFLSFLV